MSTQNMGAAPEAHNRTSSGPSTPQQNSKTLRSSASRKTMSITLDKANTISTDLLDVTPSKQWPGTPNGKGPPPSPSAIHPSFGVEHACKNVATAYSGPRTTVLSSEPLSPTASSSSTEGFELVHNPADSEVSAPFASARHNPLNTSISRAHNTSPRVHKEKARTVSLPRPFYQPSSSSQSSRFDGSPLGSLINYLSTPAMAKLFDSPSAWILYYFVLNLGLTLCMSYFRAFWHGFE